MVKAKVDKSPAKAKSPKTPASLKKVKAPKSPKTPASLKKGKTPNKSPKSPASVKEAKLPKTPVSSKKPKVPKSLANGLEEAKVPKSPAASEDVKGPKSPAAVVKAEGPKSLEKAIIKIKESDQKKKEIKYERNKRGIIMLEHIPHGFYEKEISAFFGQFGKVLRIKVARSTKTGNSRGYAYVEFEFEEVAKIAAESMNNYLMFERLVKCKLLEGPQANASKIFSNSNAKLVGYEKKLAERKTSQLKPKDEAFRVQSLNRRIKKMQAENAKLASLGINYKFAPRWNPNLLPYNELKK